MQGAPVILHHPQPLLHKKGLQPLPKPLANLWQGDVIDSGQGPPYVKVLYRSQSLCPKGRAMILHRLRWTLVDYG